MVAGTASLQVIGFDDEDASVQEYPRGAATAHTIGEPPAGIGHELVASAAEAGDGHSRVSRSVDQGSPAFAVRASADEREAGDGPSCASTEIAPAMACASAGAVISSRARNASASESRKCVSTSP